MQERFAKKEGLLQVRGIYKVSEVRSEKVKGPFKRNAFANGCSISIVRIHIHFDASLPCVIHMKISFHVWNSVKFKTITILFASLC